MPELPEVETVARDLRAALVGHRITSVSVAHPGVLRHPSPEAFTAGLRGAQVVAVERRGKFIFCPLDSGDDLVVHLGMTGHLDICAAAHPRRPHTHIVARLDDGRELRFADARRFGRVLLGHREQLRALGVLPLLGVEPLAPEFTAERFDALLRRTTRMVKSALLDQRGVAGLGNIYVDEICHRAGVRPTRRCHRLTRKQRLALHEAVVAVLHKAIDNRGSSIDDYRDLWDARGNHQEELQAYGRAGLPCFRCATLLRRTVIAGRTTVYCPQCQR
jgi:formamidopyrimidine-DNA glycosylase